MKRVVEQFLEYRGRGITLSGRELEVLSKWEANNIPEQHILLVLRMVAEDCDAKGKPFPNTLFPIVRILEKRLGTQYACEA
jgi:hypothetical protein